MMLRNPSKINRLQYDLLKYNIIQKRCYKRSHGTQTVRHYSNEPKKYTEIPKVKGYPVVSLLASYIKDGLSKYHVIQADRLKEYGPIYREAMLGEERVYVSNPDDFEKILNDESSDLFQSRRNRFWSMQEYSEKYNMPDPLLVVKEENFKRRKDAIKKGLLVPKQVMKLTEMYDDVAKDFTALINRKKNPLNEVENLGSLLTLWAFECAGVTLFQTRLGVLNETHLQSKPVLKMLEGHKDFLKKWWKLEGLMNPYYKKFPSTAWKEFEHSSDLIYDATRELCEQYEEKVTDKNAELSELERLATCIDVMRAALDTTSLTSLWSLIEFAKHPQVQEKIYEEFHCKAPHGILDSKVLQNIPYIRSCLKESLRMHPIVVQLARRLNNDLVLSGYLVPAKTLTMLQTANTYITHPVGDEEMFLPERWMKTSDCPHHNKPHPFSTLPFGYGSRACIGRRVAEIQIFTLYANLVRRFHIKLASQEVIDTKYDFLIEPSRPVSMVFNDR